MAIEQSGDRIPDMSADDMLAEMAVETGDAEWLPSGHEDKLMEIMETQCDVLATITGRFCEPTLNVHVYDALPETPKVAEGRFDVARWQVIHSRKLSADVTILFADASEAGVRPMANVAIYLSFDEAKKLAQKILATIPPPFRQGE